MATINISGSKIKSFYGGEPYNSGAIVGSTLNGNATNICVTRYEFTTGDSGATRIEFRTAQARCDINGHSTSYNGVYHIRFAFGTGASTYVGHSGNGGYGWPGSMEVQNASDSGSGYLRGWLDYNFKPNTTYYLWLFPDTAFPGSTRYSLGGCTLTTSGSYGTASTISASNGTFGSAIPVTLSNSVNSVTNTLTVTCGGITKTLLTDSTAKTVTWTPTLAEYGPAIPNAKTATATFTCTTKYGSATWGTSTKTITVSFPNSAGPSVDGVTITPYNAGSAAAAISCFVQGYSKARAAITASVKYGASVSNYALAINGASVSSSSRTQTSAAVTTSGAVAATITVTDSRGFTATTTQTFTVEPYAKPKLTNVSMFRCNSGGTADESGAFLSAYAIGNMSPLDGENSFTMSVNRMASGGSYTTETPMSSGVTQIISGLNPDVTYIARITITDALGNSTTSIATIPAQNWCLKFSVANGAVNACGIGKAPEADKVLEIPADWNIRRGTETAIFSGGGTMTGNLTLQKNAPHFIQRSGNIDAQVGKTVPSSNTALGGHYYYDMQGEACGYDEIMKGSADQVYRSFIVRRLNAQGTALTHGFYMRINADGTKTLSFTDNASRDAWIAAFGLENLPMGLKIQYGSKTTGSGGSAAVSFSPAFTSTPVVFCAAIGSSTTSVYDTRPANISSTGFTIYCTRYNGSSVSAVSGTNVNWLAVGV